MDLPLYLQIGESLTRDIAAGKYSDGERLPPEVALARGFGVSVGTLRKALAELTARGLLVRRHGSGNYVRRGAGPTGIYAFFHLELRDGAGMPTAQTLSADRLVAPAEHDSPWAKAWRIRRLRLLDGAPAALEEIWIDAANVETMDAATLPASLYRHFDAALGLRIARVEDRIVDGLCPDWTPAGSPLVPGAPCGMVLRRAESPDGRLAEVSRTWFDGSRVAYVARWSAQAA
jgi:GntR family transcriptional regulator